MIILTKIFVQKYLGALTEMPTKENYSFITVECQITKFQLLVAFGFSGQQQNEDRLMVMRFPVTVTSLTVLSASLIVSNCAID